MDTKALKKQMGAAIAMVLVAAIALGSATFAWFVSNNSVKATTTKVSAQSNSAYLVIDNATKEKTDKDSTGAATASESFTSTKLYPAQWAKTFTAVGGSEKASNDNGVYQFETAYASDKGSATEKDGTRFAIGNAETAAKSGYALANTFHIGTGNYDGIFTNLKVTGVTADNAADGQLDGAIRVLITCGSDWVVWSRDGKQAESNSDGIIKSDEFGKINNVQTDADVKVYVYYDGANDKVYTTNLDNLKECGVTVTFEATPKEFKATQD